MGEDHKMAYDRAEISRLKKDIHFDDVKKKKEALTMHHEGVVNYGKAGDDPIKKAGKHMGDKAVFQMRSPIMNRMKGFIKEGVINNAYGKDVITKKASSAEKAKARAEAIKGGMPKEVASQVIKMKSNQDGGSATAKDPGAASKQISKLGK